MSYFVTSKETQLVVDTSPVGVSAILIQNLLNKNTSTNIIAYASRALTLTKQRYFQTDKKEKNESLVWGIKHFHIYLYGALFTQYKDDKANGGIFANTQSKPPA